MPTKPYGPPHFSSFTLAHLRQQPHTPNTFPPGQLWSSWHLTMWQGTQDNARLSPTSRIARSWQISRHFRYIVEQKWTKIWQSLFTVNSKNEWFRFSVWKKDFQLQPTQPSNHDPLMTIAMCPLPSDQPQEGFLMSSWIHFGHVRTGALIRRIRFAYSRVQDQGWKYCSNTVHTLPLL